MSFPFPRPKSEPPATHNGLPVYGFSSPVLRHVCRYVESDETGRFRLGFRTARARQIRFFPAQGKIGMRVGNAAVIYPMDRLFTMRDLVPVVGSSDVARRPPDRIVKWDGMIYPEGRGSGWAIGSADAEEVMGQGGAFDLDDRGYLYAGYPYFGWGIAKVDGSNNGSLYPLVSQTQNGTTITPHTIVAVKAGGKYYAVVADLIVGCVIYDVTDPEQPVLVSGSGRSAKQDAMRRYDRTADRVAWVDGAGRVHVATNADLVLGGRMSVTLAPTQRGGFIDVAFDDAGVLWAVEDSNLWRVNSSGHATSFPVFSGLRGIRTVAAGAGYVAVVGTDRADFKYDVQLARTGAGAPALVPTDSFFKNYFFKGRADYAQPGQYVLPSDLGLIARGGKPYLFAANEGFGDVFELAGSVVVDPVPPPPNRDALIAECRRLAEEQIAAAGNGSTHNLAAFGAALDRLRTAR